MRLAYHCCDSYLGRMAVPPVPGSEWHRSSTARYGKFGLGQTFAGCLRYKYTVSHLPSLVVTTLSQTPPMRVPGAVLWYEQVNFLNQVALDPSLTVIRARQSSVLMTPSCSPQTPSCKSLMPTNPSPMRQNAKRHPITPGGRSGWRTADEATSLALLPRRPDGNEDRSREEAASGSDRPTRSLGTHKAAESGASGPPSSR